MPKLQGRLAVALFVFAMLVVFSAGLASAQEAQVTPAQPTVVEEPNPIPLWLAGGIAEVCYDGFNGCQPTAPGPCCWRCPGGSAFWSCTTATSSTQCRSMCRTACGTTCAWI